MDWFTDRHFFLLAAGIYGLSMIYSVFLWRKGFRQDDRVNYLLLLLAFGLHTEPWLFIIRPDRSVAYRVEGFFLEEEVERNFKLLSGI